jgi:pentatricopeptide repeat protein
LTAARTWPGMGESGVKSGEVDAARALIEEMLRTGFVFIDLVSSLIEELPEDAFPGEDRGAVLLGMVAGSCLPAVEAAGERECRAAIALIGAVRDRVLEDLRTAAELTRPGA